MKENINELLEEITTNFSELFTETFFIRYLSEFDKDDLLESAKQVNKLLTKKINNKLEKKLIKLGYKKDEIKLN